MQNSNTNNLFLVKHSKLEYLLKRKEWEKANKETNKLINQIINQNHQIEGFFASDLIKILPTENPSDCEFCKIDHLWVNHSGGHFGFSVQKEIYIESGGIQNDIEAGNPNVLYRFLAEVGWRELSIIEPTERIIFSKPDFRHSAKRGHLPYWYEWEPDGLGSNLFERFKIRRKDNWYEYELDENGECKLNKNVFLTYWGFLAFFSIVAQCGK